MTKNNNTKLVSPSSHPGLFQNVLIKLPDVDFESKEILDTLDFYFGVHYKEGNLVPTNLGFKYNALILSPSLVNTKESILRLDKTFFTPVDLVNFIKRVSNLKESLILISVYLYTNTSGNNALKLNFNPFALTVNDPVIRTHYHNSINYDLLNSSCTTATNYNRQNDEQIIYSVLGEPNFNCEALFTTKNCDDINKCNTNFIFISMIESNLFKSLFTYSELEPIQEFIEHYLNPRFCENPLNYFFVKRDDLNKFIISKNSLKIKNGFYILNKTSYDLLKKNSEYILPEHSKNLFSNLWFKETKTTTVRESLIEKASQAVVKTGGLSPNQAFFNKSNKDSIKDENFLKIKENSLFRITPFTCDLFTGYTISDSLVYNNKKIPLYSKVIIKNTANSLNLFNDKTSTYTCTITDKNKEVYIKVLDSKEIDKFLVLIPKSSVSNFLYKYRNELLEKIFYSNLAKTDIQKHIESYAKLISSLKKKIGMEKMFQVNYILDCIKINGYKRYKLPVYLLLMLVAEYVYYEKDSKYATLEGLQLLQYLLKLKELFTDVFEQNMSFDNDLDNITVKLADIDALHQDVITEEVDLGHPHYD